MNPLQNKTLQIVAISPEKEIQLTGTVVDVKGNTIYLSVSDESKILVTLKQAKHSRDGINTRAFFRLPTSIGAFVGPNNPTIPCSVQNISGNGICFHTTAQFNLKDIVKVSVSLTKSNSFIFTCQIVRTKTCRGNQTEYGCRICNLSAKEEASLVATIFNLQKHKID